MKQIIAGLLIALFVLSGCVWVTDTRTVEEAAATRAARIVDHELIVEFEAEEEGQADCVIKGNIARDGTAIYHMPGGLYYDRTRIDLEAGERYFCSEEEALEAGWRKSLR